MLDYVIITAIYYDADMHVLPSSLQPASFMPLMADIDFLNAVARLYHPNLLLLLTSMMTSFVYTRDHMTTDTNAGHICGLQMCLAWLIFPNKLTIHLTDYDEAILPWISQNIHTSFFF